MCDMGHVLLSVGSVVVQWYGWHGSDVVQLCVVQWLRQWLTYVRLGSDVV